MNVDYPDFVGFDWDAGNHDKNYKKHSVLSVECEQIFFNKPLVLLEDPKHSFSEKRMILLGQTDNGRRLLLIFTMRRNRVRVISARDMNKKEREFYAKQSTT